MRKVSLTHQVGQSDHPGRVNVWILFFGTCNADARPRIKVLQKGFAGYGNEVVECNVQLGDQHPLRVSMLRRPLLLPLLVVKLTARWLRLWWRSRRLNRVEVDVDASDAPPQRVDLGNAAVYVPRGYAAALAGLVREPGLVQRLRKVAYRHACEAFRAKTVVAPLRARLGEIGCDVPIG